MTRSVTVGLRERIAGAQSGDEIWELLAEGDSYLYASEKTKRSWALTVERRLKELAVAQEEGEPDTNG